MRGILPLVAQASSVGMTDAPTWRAGQARPYTLTSPMTRPRLFSLVGILALFALVVGLIITRITFFNKTRYRVGQIPQEIANQLLPKIIPISSLRPPALRMIDPIRYGNATSLVSVIEFGDYECESCRNMKPVIESVIPKYNGKVRFVWREMPNEVQHKNALSAAVFARCAGLQGRYWEAYDALTTRSSLGETEYRRIAAGLGLDETLLRACRNDPDTEASIKKDVEQARADGINSVPLTFIGASAFEGTLDEATLKQAIEKELSSL